MNTPPDKSHIGGSAGKAVSTPNRLPFSKKLYKETVKILVGPEKEVYSVHKELLCFYSDFFRAAFNCRKLRYPIAKILDQKLIALPNAYLEAIGKSVGSVLDTQKCSENGALCCLSDCLVHEIQIGPHLLGCVARYSGSNYLHLILQRVCDSVDSLRPSNRVC
ncbi:hypothetical protein D6D18_07559 [Aureobasidium pullulans]|nr:hypothetical protein D6D18_07559 [Aureobasidium pullulans]